MQYLQEIVLEGNHIGDQAVLVSQKLFDDSLYTRMLSVDGKSKTKLSSQVYGSELAQGLELVERGKWYSSVRKFRLEILDYLSRSSVHFGNFPVGHTKIVLPFTF